jgi:hypothetical protein
MILKNSWPNLLGLFCRHVQTDRQTDGRTDGQTDRRTDGQTDELIRIELGNLFGSYRLIPALKKECKGKEDSTQKTVPTECTLLSQFEIRPPRLLGILPRQDCHEHEAQKKHHSKFTQRYLSILNRDLIDGCRCQLRRLSLFNHHYQPTTNLWSPGTNTMIQ